MRAALSHVPKRQTGSNVIGTQNTQNSHNIQGLQHLGADLIHPSYSFTEELSNHPSYFCHRDGFWHSRLFQLCLLNRLSVTFRGSSKCSFHLPIISLVEISFTVLAKNSLDSVPNHFGANQKAFSKASAPPPMPQLLLLQLQQLQCFLPPSVCWLN